jgi:hypothetical protein
MDMTDREKLYATIAKLDSALRLLKQDKDFWHTTREIDEIKKSMNEIEKFKFQLIKEYNL